MMKTEQSNTTVSIKKYEEAMKAWDSIPSIQEAVDLLKHEELEQLSKMPNVRNYLYALVKENDETKRKLTKELQNQCETLKELVKVRTELNEVEEYIGTIEGVITVMGYYEGDCVIN
ncbi:hypothetical protein MHI22_11625 [Lysinibacillus sp. FSL L8-0312]|uniref:hypothetical protein n=1 Tax=Lysinibacillus sp. FSL L8-0312 TaxID=2921521 RepID=UPI0030F55AE6